MRAHIPLSIFGVIGLVSSIALLATFKPLYDFILEKQLILTNGSYSYEMWEELPDDLKMYMKLYYFNVTNYREIENRKPGTPGPKPVLEEIGPYVFREWHLKENIVWNDDNSTVTYQQSKRWKFIEEESADLDAIIVAPNIIAATAAEFTRFKEPFFASQVNALMNSKDVGMFMKFPVRNWTFDGIFEELMDFAQNQNMMELPIPYDRFGWFYPRNDSADYDGTFSMYTGESDIQNIGQISEWNFLPNINESIYPKPCGDLTGSAGEFFPPGRDDTYVDFFSPDLCRSIRFEYDQKTTVDGALGYRYKLGHKLISNKTECESNECFNPQPSDIQPLINGLLNVSTCKFDSPAYVSYPHFYLGDPLLVNQFAEGSLKPDPAKHESFISLEPRSGIPLEVAVRMQINSLIRPLSIPTKIDDSHYGFVNIDAFMGLDPTFYPMIWFETATRIDGDTDTGRLIVLVSRLHQIMYGIGGLILVIAVLLLVTAFYVKFNYNKRDKKSSDGKKKPKGFRSDVEKDSKDMKY